MYAIKTYANTKNKLCVPQNWPCELYVIEEGQKCPDGCILMTETEYEDWIKKHMPDYNSWINQMEILEAAQECNAACHDLHIRELFEEAEYLHGPK